VAKRRKLAKRLRKSARAVIGSKMARDVLEDLISAALIAAAVKLRDSGAGKRAARALGAKAGKPAGPKRKRN
jgi:hypothetical protein